MVANKKTKNPDENLDENPDEDSNQQTSEQEEALLLEAESIINAEDPDFLNQLAQIKIDTETVNSSILDKALALDAKSYTSLLNIFRNAFEFKSNTKPVLIFWTVFVSVVAVGVIVWNFKSSFLHQNLFLNSYAELGSDLKEFNPITEVESFYDNLRFAKNLVTISVMHVNLKTSENSGPNPMLVIEITTEGLSADAIVEVKDREAEFKDLLLRLTEEKTYDELTEPEGKRLLCEQYRDLLNSYLTSGQVRRVLLKSFIIKP